MGCPAGSVAEVVVPARQDRVQSVPNVRPGPAMGCFEMVANLLLEPGHALRRRARPQIRFAIPPMPMRAKAVAQELEPVPPRILQKKAVFINLGLQLRRGFCNLWWNLTKKPETALKGKYCLTFGLGEGAHGYAARPKIKRLRSLAMTAQQLSLARMGRRRCLEPNGRQRGPPGQLQQIAGGADKTSVRPANFRGPVTGIGGARAPPRSARTRVRATACAAGTGSCDRQP
jgi:hypothetical protein